jgi:hypothetical protein
LVISDLENESEDAAEELSRVIKKTHIIISDNARENEYGLNDPSSSLSPNNETNTISNDVGDMSEATCDVNYGDDTDHTVSPILGNHTVTKYCLPNSRQPHSH